MPAAAEFEGILILAHLVPQDGEIPCYGIGEQPDLLIGHYPVIFDLF
jgi:hypothetical protein